MGINIFVSLLFVLSCLIYFIPVDNTDVSKNNKELPFVVFEEPMMYTINEKYVTRVVKAKSAARYKNRDEFRYTYLTLRNLDEKKDYNLEKLKASLIVKKDDKLKLSNGVEYRRDDFVSFITDELEYDLDKKIAYNNVPFKGKYDKHFLKGNSLLLDTKKSELKVNDIHFEFDLKNKGK